MRSKVSVCDSKIIVLRLTDWFMNDVTIVLQVFKYPPVYLQQFLVATEIFPHTYYHQMERRPV